MTDNAYRSSVRGIVACALIVAALAHVPVIPEHLHEAPYMGVAFIVFSGLAMLAAGVVGLTDRRWGYRLSAGLCIAAIGLYALTRLVAFPEMGDDVGNWTETFGLLSIAAETVAALGSTAALFRHSRAASGLAISSRCGYAEA